MMFKRSALALCVAAGFVGVAHAQTQAPNLTALSASVGAMPPSPGSAAKLPPVPDSLKGLVDLAMPGAAPVSIKGGDAPLAKSNSASVPPVAAPQKPSEFQVMVADTLGHGLPVFGANLFTGNNSNTSLASIPALADYLVGPGDELVIKAWGGIEIDYHASVDASGNIYLPKMGNVYVAGVKFADLQKTLSTAIKKSFKNFELSVSLGQVRSVEVMVVGQAVAPGTYQLAPYATLMTALSAAQGPTSRGSMRSVSVKRGNKVVASLDLYKLISTGDRSNDVRLMPGDVVVVDTAQAQVALDGAVTNPAIYELKAGERLADIVGYAGGYAVSAKTDALLVERVAEVGFKRQVLEVADTTGQPSPLLRSGDIVRVPRLTNEFANAVMLRGAVAQPGRVAFKAGSHVSDVLPSRDMLITSSYWANRNGAAMAKSNTEDAVAAGLRKSMEEINWDYAVIERLDKKSLQTQLIPFNLGRALDKSPADDLALQAGDTLTVFTKDDVKVPTAKQSRLVRIEGEVLSPGVYRADAADTLQSLVQKAGGLTPQAYLYGAQLHRESVRLEQERRMKDTVDKLEHALERETRQRMADAINAEDAASTKLELDAQKDAIKALRTVKAEGRVVLDVKPANHAVADLPALTLENGDALMIPSVGSTVLVAGSVFNENSFVYAKGKSVEDYVAQAGGPVSPSASNLSYVLRADGSVQRASGSERLNPGDGVIVVEEVGKKSFMRSLRDWTQVVYQFGFGALALKALK